MRGFAALQGAFQNAILTGDDAVLAGLLDGPKEGREALLAVYRHAYSARLVEILASDFPALKAVLGDDGFETAARAYVSAHPSTHRNARWYGRGFADFLARTEPWSDRAEFGELACFETALADAFDAADLGPLTLADLAAVPPEHWGDLIFSVDPSASRLDLATNAIELWSSAAEGADPPLAAPLAATEKLIVWRDGATPMYRAMTDEEAMLWDEAARGSTFGELCVLAATFAAPDEAAGRAAGYLASWIGAGLLAQARPAEVS
ncbi:putative DNA-binding domain-containing protein [Chelatococcus sambhunathii]|uniref:DNA-binding domain-containing protein n=1 Tax=Chelatococcus sambhunathii TaxID=363953 RepID=A0ABU1DGJ8_9HYPH|nr:DNA-binding domain-containing protein [Chelatococcus sambhunathii]MDR4307129.1 putative DNA-binding domain-containing protein [Chelatococcus sambhunathii]